ncbi:MAG TPA: lipid A deacylase LpxR family protein [Pseudomonas sp.]|jgi:hypothetical protein|nr:lipid A deacylase LpxR family protein [Pseudomonas sp.]
MEGRKSLRLGLLLLAGLPVPLLADSLSIKVENDLLSYESEDGHYSGGLEVFWSFAPANGHWTRGLADALPGWAGDEVQTLAYRFGMQGYTPEDLHRRELIEDDRPYAGLIFFGVSMHADRDDARWRVTRELHLDAGLVGPGAGVGKVQHWIHKHIDTTEPRGWSHQLRNEPYLNVAYGQQWWRRGQLLGLELEYGPAVGLALGNLYTYVSTGAQIRFGRRLGRSLGIPSVTPAQSGSQFFTPRGHFAWYGFLGVEGRYMAYNMLLDGNTFKSSHSVDRREWVGDTKAGLALTWSNWQLTFASVWRTHEFHGQQGHDQFGSVTLSYGF